MEHYIVYEGERAALGAVVKEYVPLITKWANDPNATAGVLLTPPVMLEAEQSWFEGLPKRKDTDVVFAVLVREGEGWKFVGTTGIHRITWPDARGSTGSFIGDTSVHGQGVGTEAKLWLLHHAFHMLGLRKITSEVKAFNGNSLGHLIRCGYEVVGVRKQQHFYNGAFVDEVLLEIFRDRFESNWEAYCADRTLPKLSDEQRAVIKKYSGGR